MSADRIIGHILVSKTGQVALDKDGNVLLFVREAERDSALSQLNRKIPKVWEAVPAVPCTRTSQLADTLAVEEAPPRDAHKKSSVDAATEEVAPVSLPHSGPPLGFTDSGDASADKRHRRTYTVTTLEAFGIDRSKAGVVATTAERAPGLSKWEAHSSAIQFATANPRFKDKDWHPALEKRLVERGEENRRRTAEAAAERAHLAAEERCSATTKALMSSPAGVLRYEATVMADTAENSANGLTEDMADHIHAAVVWYVSGNDEWNEGDWHSRMREYLRGVRGRATVVSNTLKNYKGESRHSTKMDTIFAVVLALGGNNGQASMIMHNITDWSDGQFDAVYDQFLRSMILGEMGPKHSASLWKKWTLAAKRHGERVAVSAPAMPTPTPGGESTTGGSTR
jgi:hypothetical protein